MVYLSYRNYIISANKLLCWENFGVCEVVVDGMDQVQEWACGPTLPHGRDKSGPYRIIRPAEAGGGRYRCPPCLAGFPTMDSYTLCLPLRRHVKYILAMKKSLREIALGRMRMEWRENETGERRMYSTYGRRLDKGDPIQIQYLLYYSFRVLI